ncbi:MAG: hypothetical protein LBC77_01625, partial [Spirochaetaceae bacterium]|nr:hypothetical protein [Spirochaetaceae bacterium]
MKLVKTKGIMNYRWSCPAVSGPFCFGIFFVVTERGCRWIGNFFSVSALIPIFQMLLNFETRQSHVVLNQIQPIMNYRWSCPAVSGPFCFGIFFVVT